LNRLEPNLLLAATTGIALLLLLTTAAVYGPLDGLIRYPLMAIICAGAFVLLNGPISRRMGLAQRPPMVNAETPTAAVWSSLFPLAVILFAGVPVFWPGRDYGLLVIIGAVFFGLTAESALKVARRL
jgi:hypothetical protein